MTDGIDCDDAASESRSPPPKRRRTEPQRNLDRIMELSHVMWTVVMPNIFPDARDPLPGERVDWCKVPPGPGLKKFVWDDSMSSVLTYATLGEVFWPLLDLVARRVSVAAGIVTPTFKRCYPYHTLSYFIKNGCPSVARSLLSTADKKDLAAVHFNMFDGMVSRDAALAELFVSALHITKEDAIEHRVFYRACESGPARDAIWLASRLGITASDFASVPPDDHYLVGACGEFCNADTFRWVLDTEASAPLLDTVRVTKANRAVVRRAYEVSTRYPEYARAVTLVKAFAITLEEITRWNDELPFDLEAWNSGGARLQFKIYDSIKLTFDELMDNPSAAFSFWHLYSRKPETAQRAFWELSKDACDFDEDAKVKRRLENDETYKRAGLLVLLAGQRAQGRNLALEDQEF